jgi:multiple antibiotic resistance protein
MLVTRIAGLLLSAIAVQMVADSVRAFVSSGS